jgi:hypothetical protein
MGKGGELVKEKQWNGEMVKRWNGETESCACRSVLFRSYGQEGREKRKEKRVHELHELARMKRGKKGRRTGFPPRGNDREKEKAEMARQDCGAGEDRQ